MRDWDEQQRRWNGRWLAVTDEQAPRSSLCHLPPPPAQPLAHRQLGSAAEGLQEGAKLEPQGEHAGQALRGVLVAVHHGQPVGLDHVRQDLQERLVLAQLQAASGRGGGGADTQRHYVSRLALVEGQGGAQLSLAQHGTTLSGTLPPHPSVLPRPIPAPHLDPSQALQAVQPLLAAVAATLEALGFLSAPGVGHQLIEVNSVAEEATLRLGLQQRGAVKQACAQPMQSMQLIRQSVGWSVLSAVRYAADGAGSAPNTSLDFAPPHTRTRHRP